MKRYLLKIYRHIVGAGIDLNDQRGGRSNHLHYIKKYGRPADDIARSKAQQWCQQRLNNSSVKLLMLWPVLWLFAGAGTLFVIAYVVSSYLRPSRKKEKRLSGMALVDKRIIPDVLSGSISDTPIRRFDGFTIKSLQFLLLTYYKTSSMPILQLKLLRAVWRSRYGISGSDFVVVSMEYSSSSSMFTMFCELNHSRSFNVMHGEKILNSRDAFCRFSKFYVWDTYYQWLLQDLENKADFEVALAPMLTVNYLREGTVKNQLVYFLQGLETAEFLRDIENKLQYVAKNFGCSSIFYKCHPRYSNPDVEAFLLERKVFRGSLEECFSRFDVLCGNYSTVLYQAYISRKKVDDFSIVILDGRAAIERRFIMHYYADYMLID